MKVYVLTTIEGSQITTAAYREQWDAMHAAEEDAGGELAWSEPPNQAAEAGEARYLLDELEVQPRRLGPKAKRITVEVDALVAPDQQIESMQFFANGVSLGEPDTSAPYRKVYTRPAGQVEPIELEIETVYESGKKYRGAVASVD